MHYHAGAMGTIKKLLKNNKLMVNSIINRFDPFLLDLTPFSADPFLGFLERNGKMSGATICYTFFHSQTLKTSSNVSLNSFSLSLL